ncbi:hypothetical protein FRC03_010885 [Tulasnella sp. 419]|nr:hypothetical protein FRC02_010193 [Tulasnella sp. 418]KAG8956418.1 hypothetical protein FRC03_010885 [Tulasnella sp. 419]
MAPIHKFLSQVLCSVILAVILLQASINAKTCTLWPRIDEDNWYARSPVPEVSWAMAGLGSVCEYTQENPYAQK